MRTLSVRVYRALQVGRKLLRRRWKPERIAKAASRRSVSIRRGQKGSTECIRATLALSKGVAAVKTGSPTWRGRAKSALFLRTLLDAHERSEGSQNKASRRFQAT